MLKSLFKVLVFFIITLALLVGGGIGLLQTSYASPWAIQLVQRIIPQVHSIQSFSYHYPLHLSFTGVELTESEEELITVDSIDIWLHSNSFIDIQPQFESVRLSGISLQNGIPDNLVNQASQSNVLLHQFAITALDYAANDTIIRDLSAQIKKPRLLKIDDTYRLQGELQASLAQLYWQGEAFDNVVLDADLANEQFESKIYGLSFDWRNAFISTQAEQSRKGWRVINGYIKNLHLTEDSMATLENHALFPLLANISEVNSLDLNRFSMESHTASIINAEGSIHNLALPLELSTQSSASITFEAESLTWSKQRWLEPFVEIDVDSQSIFVHSLSALFEDGEVMLRGELTPEVIHLHHLSVNGSKWIVEQDDQLEWLTHLLKRPLKIDSLDIKQSQMINLVNEPKWQISGVNVEGKALELIKYRDRSNSPQLGLWNGALHLSASTFNYGPLFSTSPWIKTTTNSGQWILEESFIPLEHGLIEATASMDLSQVSQPWRIDIESYGVPAAMLLDRLDIPLQWNGLADFTIQATGLAGDEKALNHSLSGQFDLEFRELSVATPLASTEQSFPMSVSPVEVLADRGRVEVKPVTMSSDWIEGQLSGKLDLVEKKQETILLEMSGECFSLKRDVINQKSSIALNCVEQ
jgi:hypothetical protein